MRAGWIAMALALPGTASGAARAVAADGAAAPPALPALPPALDQLDRAADLADAAQAEIAFPALQLGLLAAEPAGNLRFRLAFRDPTAGRRDRFGIPSALSLVVAPHGLLPTPFPRLGSRRARQLLPVWVQMAFGSWSVLGGGSYASGGGGVRDSWRSGLALVRTLSPRLSLGAEFSHDSADLLDGHSNVRFGAGARYRLSGPLSVIISAGPYFEHHGGAGVRASTGLNFAF
jgi:hypothetical protein